MASAGESTGTVSHEASAAAQDTDFWVAFFRGQVAANARFWMEQLGSGTDAAPLLHEEQANLVKAISRALQIDAGWDPACDLLMALNPIAERQGLWAEWERLLKGAITASRRLGAAEQEVAFLNYLGSLNRERGDWPAAETYHQRALELSSTARCEVGVGQSLVSLGNLYRMRGLYARAERLLEDGLARLRAAGHPPHEAWAHTSLGLLYTDLDQPDRALAHHEAAYAIWSDADNLLGMAQAQHNAALSYFRKGAYDRAESYYEAALDLYRQGHARHYVAVASMDLGNVYLYRGQAAQAETLYRQAQAVMEEIGNQRGLAQVANNLGMALARQGDWDLAEEAYLRSIARWQQLGHAQSRANAEDNLAEVYLAQKKWKAAEKALIAARERLAGVEPSPQITGLIAEVEVHLAAAREGMRQPG